MEKHPILTWLFVLVLALIVVRLVIRHRRRKKGPRVTPNEFRSSVLLGLLLKANPFSCRLKVDHVGVYLMHRPWHGMVLKKHFFPMALISTVSTSEIIGCLARIEFIIKYSPGIPTVVKIPRFFSAKDARLFFQQWVHLSQVHV